MYVSRQALLSLLTSVDRHTLEQPLPSLKPFVSLSPLHSPHITPISHLIHSTTHTKRCSHCLHCQPCCFYRSELLPPQGWSSTLLALTSSSGLVILLSRSRPSPTTAAAFGKLSTTHVPCRSSGGGKDWSSSGHNDIAAAHFLYSPSRILCRVCLIQHLC